jgi:hypothetical protein
VTIKPTVSHSDNLIEQLAIAGAVLNKIDPARARAMRELVLASKLTKARKIMAEYVTIAKARS